jgi:2-oxoglutarate dehydrogenase E2 component (dihydrolipoamide succinyltransferase)
MTYQVKVPELAESLVEATVGQWHKQEGEAVAIGDLLVDLETDKVDVEVGAESAGVLVNIRRQAGEDVKIGDVLAEIDPEETASATASETSAPDEKPESTEAEAADAAEQDDQHAEEPQDEESIVASPVAQRLADEKEIPLDRIKGSGPNGRITRQDVEDFLQQQDAAEQDKEPSTEEETVSRPSVDADDKTIDDRPPEGLQDGGPREERIRLSRRRRTIAQRLTEAQQTAAILTTFNDVDMSAIMALRKRRGESFRERFGVKLGLMSFFVKGTIAALRAFPRLNAAIDGDEMVLKHYYDIGIAVGAEEGLVVPVIREADRKSFAEIEEEINDLAQKARQGSLSIEDIRGGTFTISNGGIFGSLLSTPILNPPQVGILGLHRIEERPVAVEGEVVIRPMMYLALSYDHRLIDGREAVQFLGRLKELVEDPETLLLEG